MTIATDSIINDNYIYIRQVITEEGVFYRPTLVRTIKEIVHRQKWFGFCQCSRVEKREFEVPMIQVINTKGGKKVDHGYEFTHFNTRWDGVNMYKRAQFKTFPAMIKAIRTVSDVRIIDKEIN